MSRRSQREPIAKRLPTRSFAPRAERHQEVTGMKRAFRSIDLTRERKNYVVGDIQAMIRFFERTPGIVDVRSK